MAVPWDRALPAGPRPPPPHLSLRAVTSSPHGNLPLSLSWHDTACQSCGAPGSLCTEDIFSQEKKIFERRNF